MKLLLSIFLFLFLIAPSNAAVTPPSADMITMSKEQMMQLQLMFNGIDGEKQAAQEAAEYWYLQYEELKQCIMENPDAPITTCLDTL